MTETSPWDHGVCLTVSKGLEKGRCSSHLARTGPCSCKAGAQSSVLSLVGAVPGPPCGSGRGLSSAGSPWPSRRASCHCRHRLRWQGRARSCRSISSASAGDVVGLFWPRGPASADWHLMFCRSLWSLPVVNRLVWGLPACHIIMLASV